MLRLIVVAVLGAVLPVAPAAAQESAFVFEELPPHLQSRVDLQDSQLLLEAISLPDDFFIAALKTWDTSAPIRVCFFGGPRDLRARIASVANGWTQQGAYVPLDFGDMGDPRICAPTTRSEIRVGFAYRGYWSLVGTDSANLAPQAEQTMNFSLFDVNPPPEPNFSQTVLHEFGHALGFRHEHQGYLAPCADEFNWDAVYAYLSGPPNSWPREKIDHNLRPIAAGNNNSDFFDVHSVMLYAFPKQFYNAGVAAECFSTGNFMLSEGDILGLRKYYPADIEANFAIRAGTLQAYSEAVDALELTDTQKTLATLRATAIFDPQSFDSAVGGNELTFRREMLNNLIVMPGN
ncbi:MAG: hypothetical protein WD674_00300 [Cucumibacter sp.]